MSTENENQNAPSPSTEAAASPQKVPIITCGICEETINDDDTKLICTNQRCGKTTCNKCINGMFAVMFGQPALTYPLLCGACQRPFNITDIDQILVKQERYEQFIACVLPLFWSKDCLEENEKLAQCMYIIKYSFSFIKFLLV
jgi:hypothetical protein